MDPANKQEARQVNTILHGSIARFLVTILSYTQPHNPWAAPLASGSLSSYCTLATTRGAPDLEGTHENSFWQPLHSAISLQRYLWDFESTLHPLHSCSP